VSSQVARPEIRSRSRSPCLDESSSKPRILVIDDDDEQIRALARAMLEPEDYDVELAKNGEEGLRCFAAHVRGCVRISCAGPGRPCAMTEEQLGRSFRENARRASCSTERAIRL
jgi:hypothetical protein